MALQFSTAYRNAALDAFETTVGTSAVVKVFTGAQPANCAAADSGTVLATFSLPSDYMNAASSGSKTKTGTWQDASADNSGTIGHFRLYASDGTTCHCQGTAGTSGDLVTDTGTVTAGQVFNINTFTLQIGGS